MKVVLISAANRAGKTFFLRRLERTPYPESIVVFEMDPLRYWVPERLAVEASRARKRFRSWLSEQPPSALLAELVANVEASTEEHGLIKMKLLELATEFERVITVNPETIRHDPEATRFLRILESHLGIGIRHVLLHPTSARYLVNLYHRGAWSRSDRGLFFERARLYANRGRFDHVLRPGLIRKCSVDRILRGQVW